MQKTGLQISALDYVNFAIISAILAFLWLH